MQAFVKIGVVATTFCVSFLGLHVSTHHKQLVKENVNVTVVELSTQAKAYCNEAYYSGEYNGGACDGMFNNPNSRCIRMSASACRDCTIPY